MRVDRLWLTDFRNYESADLTLAPGLTVVVGDNGEGKTNLLDAVGYLASLASFRGAPDDALVRQGTERAVVRAEADRDGRSLLIEAEIVAGGRNRVQVNRQPLRRSRDLLGALRTSAFSPDDLVLVKGGPAERRRYLYDTLVALHPRNDQLRGDLDRILRQRSGDVFIYRYDQRNSSELRIGTPPFIGIGAYTLFHWDKDQDKSDRLMIFFDPVGVVSAFGFRLSL